MKTPLIIGCSYLFAEYITNTSPTYTLNGVRNVEDGIQIQLNKKWLYIYRNHKLLGAEPNTLCLVNTNANKKLMVQGREITDDVLKYIEELKVNIPAYTYPNTNITAEPYHVQSS